MARNGRPTIVRYSVPPLYFAYNPHPRGARTYWINDRERAHIFPSRAEAQRTVFGEGISYEDVEEER